MDLTTQVKGLKERFKAQAALMALLVAVLWVLAAANRILPESMSPNQWLGVKPRTLAGLPGIFFSPVLHHSFHHVAGNSISFFILGWMVLLAGERRFVQVTAAVGILSGLGIWLFGAPNTVHVGISGVIFGYIGYLVARGWHERKPASILIALGVGIYHLGTIFGLIFGALNTAPEVSWSGHFFGFLGGILTAWWLHGEARRNGAGSSDRAIS